MVKAIQRNRIGLKTLTNLYRCVYVSWTYWSGKNLLSQKLAEVMFGSKDALYAQI